MNLALQPPRRPTNPSLAGIVAVARLTDKARAHVAETLGDFVYGNDSGLDRITLEFLGLDADDYAEAAAQYSDEDLAGWISRATDLTQAEIAEFNAHHLRREPDEAGMARLKERIKRYEPATAPTTVFASIELDDWGTFRECDLTRHAPRSPYDRAVAGIYGLARMADKARADKSGKLNDYIYDCPIDQAITTFLGFTADAYREAAWLNLNDIELGEWATPTVRDPTRRKQPSTPSSQREVLLTITSVRSSTTPSLASRPGESTSPPGSIYSTSMMKPATARPTSLVTLHEVRSTPQSAASFTSPE